MMRGGRLRRRLCRVWLLPDGVEARVFVSLGVCAYIAEKDDMLPVWLRFWAASGRQKQKPRPNAQILGSFSRPRFAQKPRASHETKSRAKQASSGSRGLAIGFPSRPPQRSLPSQGPPPPPPSQRLGGHDHTPICSSAAFLLRYAVHLHSVSYPLVLLPRLPRFEKGPDHCRGR
jgi:hypothetical protein